MNIQLSFAKNGNHLTQLVHQSILEQIQMIECIMSNQGAIGQQYNTAQHQKLLSAHCFNMKIINERIYINPFFHVLMILAERQKHYISCDQQYGICLINCVKTIEPYQLSVIVIYIL